MIAARHGGPIRGTGPGSTSEVNMRKLVTLAVLGMMAASAGWARADEEKVALDKVPAAVRATVKKRFPKAEVLDASKETEDGKTMYEVTVKDAGHKIDVTMGTDGKLVSIERQIDQSDLPKKVSAAVTAKYPDAKYEIVEQVIKVENGKEKLAYYEVLLSGVGKNKVELEIAADGH